MEKIAEIKEALLSVSEGLKRLWSFVFLHVIYFVGVGVSGIGAKIIGKRFLSGGDTDSTWRKVKGKNNMERMY